jgi:hypothetical protein
MATVTGLVLLFAFTSTAVIWLARDVGRTVANRSAAQSIAFQAARAGAQELTPGDIRDGSDALDVDAERAIAAATNAATDLFGGYALDGSVVRVTVGVDIVEVEIRVRDTAGDVTGVAAARSEPVP